MFQIILASARPKALQTWSAALSANRQVQLRQAASGAEALELVRAAAPHLVIIDSNLPDAAPLELVQKLLMVNALVNTAVVSPLSDEEFHEASEGLGVLARLPEEPDVSEVTTLLSKLQSVLGMNG